MDEEFERTGGGEGRKRKWIKSKVKEKCVILNIKGETTHIAQQRTNESHGKYLNN